MEHPLDVEIVEGRARLPGVLALPRAASGVVLFAHGSGSSRRSVRNRSVAEALQRAGLGTLLFDLLTEPEGADRRNVFDIGLLARRVLAAVAFARGDDRLAGQRIGLFGASTGAAAALIAAAEDHGAEIGGAGSGGIGAVVSRGGRVDLAADWLGRVRAPTLLLVGGEDREVLSLNRESARLLTCEHRLEVVEGATHLFEEPGALERVASSARSWFVRHLGEEALDARRGV